MHFKVSLLENVYIACLVHELNQRGLRTAALLPLPVHYNGVTIDCGCRLDIVVENTVVVEVKSVDAITPVHQAQLLTYLKLSDKYVGLLINFNVVHLRDGIRRMVNGKPPAGDSVTSVPSVVNSQSSVSSVVNRQSAVSSESSVVNSRASIGAPASWRR